jgi:hypothetical protein
MSRRDIPEPNDDLVDEVVVGSVELIHGVISHVEKQPIYDREDWFKRPFEVCELLGDRLNAAEWCLKEDVSYEGYLAIVEYMGIYTPRDGGGWPGK